MIKSIERLELQSFQGMIEKKIVRKRYLEPYTLLPNFLPTLF
jgi:hypothetical protein